MIFWYLAAADEAVSGTHHGPVVYSGGDSPVAFAALAACVVAILGLWWWANR